jgi:hypothetical protein
MTVKKPSPLTELLGRQDSGLKSLAAEARRLEALRRRILGYLPSPAADHCLGADLKDGVLTLYMDSAAWTTGLRYQHAELLGALRQELSQPCHTLKLRVLPEPIPGVPPKPPPRTLSTDTRQLLDATAAGIDDATLAAALRRLARDKPR